VELSVRSEELIQSFKIEDEDLDYDHVRSSIANRLGLDTAGLGTAPRFVQGIVEMYLEATTHFDEPLTDERLLNWHKRLFPVGICEADEAEVGCFRKCEELSLLEVLNIK